MPLKTIKITEEERKHLDEFWKNSETAQTTIDHGSNRLRKANNRIWKILEELYPEMINADPRMDWKKGEIIYTKKLPDEAA